jgi:hypothetical protein
MSTPGHLWVDLYIHRLTSGQFYAPMVNPRLTYANVSVCDRFVGWLKHFIHNRSAANENMLRGYLSASIARTMPYEVTTRIQKRMRKKSSSKGPSSQFIKSHRGFGRVEITPNKHNSKLRVTLDFDVLVEAFQAVHNMGLVPGAQLPRQMTQMLAGVTINGKKWTSGMGCEFHMPGGSAEDMPKVGKLEFFCLLDLGTHSEEDGLFVVVKEHEVVKRKCRVRYIHKKATRRLCFPAHCLTYALYFAESYGDRPVQFPLETDQMFKARMARPWPRNVRQTFAVPIAAAF